MKTFLPFFMALAIVTSKSDTLIGTYDVNYRWNTAGCAPPGGDFSNLLYGDPYSCVGSPGPYYIDAEPGRYKVVFLGNPCSVWSSGHRNVGLGQVEFDHTFGQIVLYAWDWVPWDNPDTFTTVELYRVGNQVDLQPTNLRLFVPPHPDSTFANPPTGPLPINYPFFLDAEIANNGSSDSGAFHVSFYLSTDENISVSDDILLVGIDGSPTLQFDNIPATTRRRLVKQFVLPSLPKTASYAGQLWIGMIVDSNSDVDEADETNNQNQGEDIDEVKVFLVDANPHHGLVQNANGGRFTYRDAIRWLRQNHFDPPILLFDDAYVWSRESNDTIFSRFAGVTMDASAFRIQAVIINGVQRFNSIHPTPVIEQQGPFYITIQGGDSTFNPAGLSEPVPEPNPRTASNPLLQLIFGPWPGGVVESIPWFEYVRRFHENF